MSTDDLEAKAEMELAKGMLGLLGIPTGVTEVLFAFLRQTGLKHTDEITWQWISDIGKEMQALRARVAVLEEQTVTPRDTISLFLSAWDAVLRTTQQHKRDCLRRAFVHCWAGGKDRLRTNEYLLNLVAQLDDLDLLVLGELGRRTQEHIPKDHNEIPNCGLLPQPEDFDLPLPDVAPEVRVALIEGCLRRLAAHGLAIDAMAAATQRMAGMGFAAGYAGDLGHPARPHFVVSQLGLALISFSISE